ncbi:MAG TPA: ATP-binding protein [Dehalococcoidia bacterium]|nr:ATP-binding protein [Dehalococcoidia bacterium]
MFGAARWRLATWFAAAFVLILVVIGGAVFLSTRSALYDQVNDDLKVRNANLQGALIRQFGPQGPVGIRRDDFQRTSNLLTAGGYSAALIIESEDEPIGTASIEGVNVPDFAELEESFGQGSGTLDTETSEGEDIRLYIERLGPEAFIAVGRSIEPEQEALRRLIFFLLIGGAAGIALSTLGGYLLAGRALRPIKDAMDSQRTFVADASHELRTPLSLIRANAEILKREGAGDQEGLDDIIKETDHLSYLVGQMLTLARSDVREAPFTLEPVELSNITADVVRQAQVLAEQKQITLSYENTGGVIVAGDEQRLRELTLILLDNALKYTDDGGQVSVAVSQNGSRARLTVADSGRGIPPEDIPNIFDRFYRVDKARSREMGGTGLGLAIARWITNGHGGTISLESEVGKGTTVAVELPIVQEGLGAGRR